MKVKNDYLHIRISSDLKDKLREKATEEGRTVSNLVVYLLSKYVSEGKNNEK